VEGCYYLHHLFLLHMHTSRLFALLPAPLPTSCTPLLPVCTPTAMPGMPWLFLLLL